MALQLSYDDPYGVTHLEAYVRIVRVNDDFISDERTVDIKIYHDAAARRQQKQGFPYTYTMPSVPGDPRATAYDALRRLPEFVAGVDA